ncbi:MAG: prepilin-type N-terminal cleavage/methylation domain-containing protein [Clostridia bacterium]
MNRGLMMINNKKGMTLIEVLVAFAILIILAAAFLLLFSTSVTNIFNFGAESRAVARTSEKMEVLYNLDNVTGTAIETELDALNGNSVVIKDDLYIYNGIYDFNYYYEASDTGVASGYDVTLVAFYRNGEKHVNLNSFIKAGD